MIEKKRRDKEEVIQLKQSTLERANIEIQLQNGKIKKNMEEQRLRNQFNLQNRFVNMATQNFEQRGKPPENHRKVLLAMNQYNSKSNSNILEQYEQQALDELQNTRKKQMSLASQLPSYHTRRLGDAIPEEPEQNSSRIDVTVPMFDYAKQLAQQSVANLQAFATVEPIKI